MTRTLYSILLSRGESIKETKTIECNVPKGYKLLAVRVFEGKKGEEVWKKEHFIDQIGYTFK